MNDYKVLQGKTRKERLEMSKKLTVMREEASRYAKDAEVKE